MNFTEESKGLENLMHDIQESVSEGDVLSEAIPKDKYGEIRQLLDVLTHKFEVLKMLRDVPSAKRSLERELSEKYVLGDKNSSECDPASATLFGMSNMDFQEPEVKEKCEKCRILPPDRYCGGVSVKLDQLTNFLKVRMDLLKLQLAVQREHYLLRTTLEQYTDQLAKALQLQREKQEELVQAAYTLNDKAYLLMLDTEISVYEAMQEYFTEDEVVVEATRKLKEVLIQEVHKVKFALMECQAQLAAYKKLEGTDFEDIVKEYKEICAAIDKKKWTIEMMTQNAEEDACSESVESV